MEKSQKLNKIDLCKDMQKIRSNLGQILVELKLNCEQKYNTCTKLLCAQIQSVCVCVFEREREREGGGKSRKKKTCLKVQGQLEEPETAIVKTNVKFSVIHFFCHYEIYTLR